MNQGWVLLLKKTEVKKLVQVYLEGIRNGGHCLCHLYKYTFLNLYVHVKQLKSRRDDLASNNEREYRKKNIAEPIIFYL
jgi:hypothetical protein